MSGIRLGLVGVGKIARDQHFPSIEATDGIALAAAASRSASVDGIANFTSLTEMLSGTEIDAVGLCTPPQVRYALALEALKAGRHVLLEKPPGATLSEVEDLVEVAREKGVTLFATWHSRFAPAVEPAWDWLAKRSVRRAVITWKEDVRRWHPGQEWIWEPGGLGVFDPGINALSIATHILPTTFFLTGSTLSFPENRQAPIAAKLAFTDANGLDLTADFDWRQEGPQTWDIVVETEDGGSLELSEGGKKLTLDGKPVIDEPDAEYRGIYRHFVDLVGSGTSDVDIAPLRHVADAFMLGRRETVDAFHEEPI
ncbi:putative d-galactose 1-dehydrogenase protein [Fulvimarina pelagi HTCC2506]|uniref:Putative d-galactose 1-dehydrogenase protein n=1 Tax=Fulvimarina pelagi HTCC2506 TaxID=314231 RepID=Q0G5K9_9HYPH|nr:Gfo/Idh/MocA family oxidoreductase [Fulvimarina pelagi]EAU43055.1 putative d-galactose 1-dehydrogenase protein [Fulvimarina pelagi HTCC2506]